MSDLVVIGFDGPLKAEEVLWRLRALKRQHLIDLEDAVVAVRDEAGEVQIRQSFNLATLEASSGLISGGLLGTLVGMVFMNPMAGFLLGGMFGMGAGALAGSLSDYGISDDFIKSLAETIPANSSALFILVRKSQPDRILAELSDIKGKVLKTTLSPEQETRLKKALLGPAQEAGT